MDNISEGSASPIAAGDVVILRSGGPLMTVVKLLPGATDGPSARCVWFGETFQKSEDVFLSAALQKPSKQEPKVWTFKF